MVDMPVSLKLDAAPACDPLLGDSQSAGGATAPRVTSAAPLRVCHIERQMSWSGQVSRSFELGRRLQDRGAQVWFATSAGSKLGERARKAGLGTLDIPLRGAKSYVGAWRLGRFLRQNQVQILHCHGPRDHAIGVLGAWASRRRVTVLRTKHSCTKLKNAFFARAWFGLTHQTVAVSDFVARQLDDDGIRKRVVTIPDAVDTERFRPHAPVSETSESLGILPGEFVVGTVSRLHRSKGIETLLRAFRRLVDNASDQPLRLLLVGKRGQQWAPLIHELGLADRVTLSGFRSDIPAVLAQLDVFVLPSRNEALGTAAIEAISTGVPVVASRVGGLPEVVVEGVTGYTVPPDDPTKLAVSLSRVIAATAPERQAMGRRGRERALERFGLDAQVEATIALYRSLLGHA
ncbi:MAG: glycosyltransferase family 4 protein [Planctomycetota bacterium]|jgi:glycosyltransferase involved in cell wall biosynthesis